MYPLRKDRSTILVDHSHPVGVVVPTLFFDPFFLFLPATVSLSVATSALSVPACHLSFFPSELRRARRGGRPSCSCLSPMHFPDTFIWLRIELCCDSMADNFQVIVRRCGRVLKANASGVHPAFRQHFATVKCEICESHFALLHAKAIKGS